MTSILNIISFILIFLSVYVQIFFLITFLENRKKIVIRDEKTKLTDYPAVTIVVPCWNEEKTVYKTVLSLLNLNYPKDKVKIFLIDDGSTDGTLNILRRFDSAADLNGQYRNIKVFHKKNGGKYTALNLGLEHSETDFFGCLDADSFADPESLVRIMSYFEKDKSVMAVTPSVTVHNTKNIIQSAQKVEYNMGVYFKKMLGFMGAINVTPGPLTIFRKKVFDDLGPYRHGHNTEDMEITYRMQKNHYKIDNCNDAYVYTNTPLTLRKLYRQRLRWIYGFINNTLDYRSMLFRKKYGNFALFTLPTGIISILAVNYLFYRIVYNFGNFLYSKFLVLNTVGWRFTTKITSPDLFFWDMRSSMFLIIFIYFLVIFAIIFGRKMVERKWAISFNVLFFFVLFRVVAPIWLLNAVYNTILKRRPNWR